MKTSIKIKKDYLCFKGQLGHSLKSTQIPKRRNSLADSYLSVNPYQSPLITGITLD